MKEYSKGICPYCGSKVKVERMRIDTSEWGVYVKIPGQLEAEFKD